MFKKHEWLKQALQRSVQKQDLRQSNHPRTAKLQEEQQSEI